MTFPLHVRLKLFFMSGHSRRDYFVQGKTGVFGYIRYVHFPARPSIGYAVVEKNFPPLVLPTVHSLNANALNLL